MAKERSMPFVRHLTGEYAIPQGAHWRQPFRIRYSDDNGATYTNWPDATFSGVMTVRNDYDSPVLLTCSTDNGRLELGTQGTAPNDYSILITCSDVVTGSATLAALEYGVYDLKVTDAYGHVTTVYHGRIALERTVEA